MSSDVPLDPVSVNGPLLVVITGPSGVGKDTVLARLKEVEPASHLTVSAASVAAVPHRAGASRLRTRVLTSDEASPSPSGELPSNGTVTLLVRGAPPQLKEVLRAKIDLGKFR